MDVLGCWRWSVIRDNVARFFRRSVYSGSIVTAVGWTFLACAALQPVAAQGPELVRSQVLPYRTVKQTLPNGLDIIIIETPEFRDVVSYNTLVLAGARNETEPGKSGLAHLFEHILFRHRYAGEENGYNRRMDALGTHNNAWTWFDVTFYHPLTFTANLEGREVGGEQLPGLIELESSRFKALDITEQIFRTEAGAVLGEYRRGASSPTLRMSEKLLELHFPHHPYGHTTIGYYEDVLDMPNEYEAAVQFYQTWYRPNNCVLIIAGDVRAAELLPKLQAAYGSWERGETPEIKPTGEPPTGPQRAHVPWDADVAPMVWVSYRLPAFRPGTREGAVMQLLSELLVSPASPLYVKLRYQKQLASDLALAEGTQGFESFDPRAIIISARLYKEQLARKGKEYFDEVIRDIEQEVAALQKFSAQEGAAALLQVMKSKYRYDFLAGLDSPATIAETFAWYYRFQRDPLVLDHLLESVQNLEPEDIDRFAARYMIPERQVIVTMAYEGEAAGR